MRFVYQEAISCFQNIVGGVIQLGYKTVHLVRDCPSSDSWISNDTILSSSTHAKSHHY